MRKKLVLVVLVAVAACALATLFLLQEKNNVSIVHGWTAGVVSLTS